jgi:hypothetical protein
VVVTEILQGLTRDVSRVEHYLSQWDLLEPSGSRTYREAADFSPRTRQGREPHNDRCANRGGSSGASRYRLHTRQGFFSHRKLDWPPALSPAITMSRREETTLS